MDFSTFILCFCLLISIADISYGKKNRKNRKSHGAKIEYWKVADKDYIPRQQCPAMRSIVSIGNCTTDADVFPAVKFPAFRAKCECLTCKSIVELVCKERVWIRAHNSSSCDYPACGSASPCNDELIPEELICTNYDISPNTRHCVCRDACNLDEDLRCINGTWFYPDSACGNTNSSTRTVKHDFYLKFYHKNGIHKFGCKNGRKLQGPNERLCEIGDGDYQWDSPMPVCEEKIVRNSVEDSEETDTSPEPFDPYEFDDDDDEMNANKSKNSLTKTEISLICVVTILSVAMLLIFIAFCYHRRSKTKKSSEVSSNSDAYTGDSSL